MNNYNPYRKYCGLWWRYWLNLPGDIIDLIKKLYDYIPLLWDDRDFDFAYLLRMMRFKCLRMRNCIENNAIIAHREDVVSQLSQLDVLLRNVVDEDPDDEWSMHYDQWDSHIKRFKDCKNPKEHHRTLRQSHHREERNWHSLWKHIDKYARGWWD